MLPFFPALRFRHVIRCLGKFFVTVPEILTVSAAVSKGIISFTPVPVDLAAWKSLATPAAIPVHFQKATSFDLFNKKSHRNKVSFYFGTFHQLIEFLNLFISPVNINDKYFFSVNRKIFFCHGPIIPGLREFFITLISHNRLIVHFSKELFGATWIREGISFLRW